MVESKEMIKAKISEEYRRKGQKKEGEKKIYTGAEDWNSDKTKVQKVRQ